MASRIIFLGIIILIVIILIAAFLFIILNQNKKKQKENAISLCRQALLSIIPELTPGDQDDIAAKKIWVNLLDRYDYLGTLYQSGSMIIFGNQAMGLSSVLKKITRHVNLRFQDTNQLAFFINIPEIPCRVGTIESALPDEIYRSIISSTMDTLLWNVEQKAGEKAYQQSGLYQLDTILKDELSNSIIEMPTTEIGQTLNDIMSLLDIKHFKICLNQLSVLQTNTIPFLLNLLSRTFQSSRKFDMVIGGEMNDLQLITDTKEGPVGIQFGHDIFLGLNLREILLPQTDNMPAVTTNETIRTEFLKTAIDELNLYSGDKNSNFQYFNEETFASPEDWKILFHEFDGDVEKIMKILPALRNWAQEKNEKISRKNLKNIFVS